MAQQEWVSVGSIYQNSGPASLCCSLLMFGWVCTVVHTGAAQRAPRDPDLSPDPSVHSGTACNGQIGPSPTYHPKQSSPPSALVQL